MGEMISFASNGKQAQGYFARPTRGNGRGVLVIQEWWGLNDNIKGIAERFAAEGYAALAPDLYNGQVVDEPDEAGKLFMALNIDEAEKDMRGAIRVLKEETGMPVGTVGFCMGGALALYAAMKNPEDVGACVDFYGVHPAVQYDWDALQAPLLALWAEHDDWCRPNIPVHEEALTSRGKVYEFHMYAGTHHAFFNDEHIDTYDAEAAADAWRRTLDWFAKHL